MESSYLISMNSLHMSKKMKSRVSSKINFMKMKPISKINMGSSYLISMEILHMRKKMKSLISRKINFTKTKPISKVSPYIFITMNALVCMSSISMLLLLSRDEASTRARGARAPPTAVEYVKPLWSPTYSCQVLYLDKRL
jgi:hypothetical protein